MHRSLELGGEHVWKFLAQSGEKVQAISHRVLSSPNAEQIVAEYTAVVQSPTGDVAKHVIAKFYNDHRGQVAYNAMRGLSRQLSDADPIAVPTPYAYEPSNGILLQERVPGQSCCALQASQDHETKPAEIGRALACLHRQRGVPGIVRTISDHIEELIRPHPTELIAAYPEYRDLIVSSVAMFCELISMETFDPVPLHRDFQLRQLFHGKGRVWVVDWDTFALGDPAFDVAYFLAYLKTHFRDSTGLRSAFLNGYGTSPRPDASMLDKYEAFNFLRRACRRFRVRDQGWELELHRMFRLLDMTLSSC